jgi:hypothetical protein
MRKSLCIISFSPIASDGRVLRQIKYLAPHFDLTVIGYGPPNPAFVDDPRVRWLPVAAAPRPTPHARLDGLLRRAGRLWPPAFDCWYWRQTDFAYGGALAANLQADLFYPTGAPA